MIPEGKVSNLAVKYLKGNKDSGAGWICFGVTKENFKSDVYLGSLLFDWSIHL